MPTYIEIILLEYIFSLILTREFLLCAHGWAGQTQLCFWRRISQSEIRNSATAEKIGIGKRGRTKIPSPQPPFFLPACLGFAPKTFGRNLKLVVKNQSYIFALVFERPLFLPQALRKHADEYLS